MQMGRLPGIHFGVAETAITPLGLCRTVDWPNLADSGLTVLWPPKEESCYSPILPLSTSRPDTATLRAIRPMDTGRLVHIWLPRMRSALDSQI